MRRAWPPVYRPTPQQKVVVSAAAIPQLPPMTRLRRDTVAAAAASGACYLIAAPCTCISSPGTLTVRNQQQHAAPLAHHRGPPPPLPARNGDCSRPYRYCAPCRPQMCQVTMAKPPLHPQQQQLYHQHQYQHLQQYTHPQQQRPCAYVKPRPSRSLENLLRVVELDDPASMASGHHGVYEKSSHYGSPRRKLKVSGKENRLHAWKRRSMESLLSARDAAALATKTFEFFNHHVRFYNAVFSVFTPTPLLCLLQFSGVSSRLIAFRFFRTA